MRQVDFIDFNEKNSNVLFICLDLYIAFTVSSVSSLYTIVHVIKSNMLFETFLFTPFDYCINEFLVPHCQDISLINVFL